MMRREVLRSGRNDDRADVPQIRDLCPRPASLAGTIACARSATCNLVKTFDT
jgi:hypothetical protein